MLSGISILCFAASYTVALCLEFSRLFFRVRLRTAVMVGFVVAGLLAHSLYLSREAHLGLAAGAPLSSWYHGCLLIAWLLAAAYVVFSLWRTRTAVGLIVLPTILALVMVAPLFPKQPQLSSAQAHRVWSLIHGFALLLGTATVVVGFLAGVMYLAQSYRLKHKKIRPRGLRLPSLERLQQVSEGALVASSCLLLAGLLSGILLNLLHRAGEAAVVPWTDPVVWTSGGLLSWLVVALVFNAFYKPARSGRKVAYLTVASFVFLSLVLGMMLLVPSAHVAPSMDSSQAAAVHSVDTQWGHLMQLNLVGCSHQTAPLAVRERLAFTGGQVTDALSKLRDRFPRSELVLLSTCNRVELYTASEDAQHIPTYRQIVEFISDYHGLAPDEIARILTQCGSEDAVRHLFSVAASLDSMVMGEAQILSQVKEAYQLATAGDCTGPLTHSAFQAAIGVARRVASETTIHQRRVSIPSVAVADFARQVFERFDDKCVLVIGAGEMGEETARYLIDEGARQIIVVNRSRQRARKLAKQFDAQVGQWDELDQLLVKADVVVSTTGATHPVVTLDRYHRIEAQRYQRPLFVLDLAVPRDFDARIGDCLAVYLFSIDDLKETCDANRKLREKEWPRAQRIISEEMNRFFTDWNHRAAGPTIRRLREQADQIKAEELKRLLTRSTRTTPGAAAKRSRWPSIAWSTSCYIRRWNPCATRRKKGLPTDCSTRCDSFFN